MSRRRRIFDIEMPGDAKEEAAPEEQAVSAPAPGRRGPMASAISENASALQARSHAEAAIRAENDALAHEYVALRDKGQVVLKIPLDQVHTNLLTRERLPGEDEGLADLITSLRDVGLSNPIRVEPRADGSGYELIQGHRRLTAYRALLESDGAGWAEIPALIIARGNDVAGLYRRMVDENIIRKDLSFAEMANAAQNYAADPATPENDLKGAIGALFQSAPYSKRSYIRSFARLLDAIGTGLHYPSSVPRKLGVDLSRVLEAEPALAAEILSELGAGEVRSEEEELEVLRRYAAPDDARAATSGQTSPRGRGKNKAGSKTTFDLRTASGRVKCTAASGRLEIKADRDFSTMERERLERAIAALMDGLD